MIRRLWDRIWLQTGIEGDGLVSRVWFMSVDPPYRRGVGIRFRTTVLGWSWENPHVTPEAQLGGRAITEEEWVAMKEWFRASQDSA